MAKKVIIAGAGIFGVTASLSLLQRGYSVTLLDPGPLPHPLAESTDISKIVRMDYGPDEDYMSLMEEALPLWRSWNQRQPRALYHEVGVAFVCRDKMQPKGFEYESFRLLNQRGHSPQRLNKDSLVERFPAFTGGQLKDGYYNPEGGFAESGAVVAWLVQEAVQAGVTVRPSTSFQGLLQENNRVVGIQCSDGEKLYADEVVISAGSWVPHLLPELAPYFRSVGQPVFHIKPGEPHRFTADKLPVFGGDISNTGFYGFPLSASGVVKIANHGVGRVMHPESPERRTTQEEEGALRRFLQENLPMLAEAPIEYSRICVYCDTLDEHFWIAKDPTRENLTIATGGSGHAFKFAPLLGDFIADALQEKPRAILQKFAWRVKSKENSGQEAARHRDH